MEGKEVVVLCPPPRKEEKIEEYRICEEILHDKCIKEGITVIKWGELIYKSGLGKDVIYYDKVHFSNEGRDLIWNEICGILKQKGVIMKKKNTNPWIFNVSKNKCLACGSEDHKKTKCKYKFGICERCGIKDDHNEYMCKTHFTICAICGRYAHTAAKCPYRKRKN